MTYSVPPQTRLKRALGSAFAVMILAAWAGCASSSSGGGGEDLAAGGGGGKPDLTVCTGKCQNPDYCDGDPDCTDPKKPVCDQANHLCVPCTSDNHCDPGQLCNLASHTCLNGCSQGHACAPDGGICEQDAGLCVDCLADSDCLDPAKPRCDSASHRCFPCNPTNDNCPWSTYCALQAGEYKCASGCKADPDCNPQAPDGGLGGDDDGGVPDGGMGGGKPMLYCEVAKHMCVQCTTDEHCPLGSICRGNLCVPGCTLQHGCDKMLACCGMPGNLQCTDTTGDFQNCGGCGVVCQGGFNCCNSGCSDPRNDVLNCGMCGNACKAPHSTPGCMARTCTIVKCDPGWADCVGGYQDGCETNIDTNPNNCGGCNNACSLPNALPGCKGGMCAVLSCFPGWGNCDNQPGNGCEADVNNNNANCGACGAACSSNHVQPFCKSGTCTGPCENGWLDCDTNKQTNGCEVDSQSDTKNCGTCGNDCSATCKGNVKSASCGKGVCSVASCDQGFYDVNQVCADGCECQAVADGAQVCAMAVDVGALKFGDMDVKRTGTLVGTLTDAWYKVTFVNDMKATTFHPAVTLTKNLNNSFKFDVQNSCTQGDLASTCPMPETGKSEARTSWETRYQMNQPLPDPTSPNWQPINMGADMVVWVHVTRGNIPLPATCDAFKYELTFSNK